MRDIDGGRWEVESDGLEWVYYDGDGEPCVRFGVRLLSGQFQWTPKDDTVEILVQRKDSVWTIERYSRQDLKKLLDSFDEGEVLTMQDLLGMEGLARG